MCSSIPAEVFTSPCPGFVAEIMWCQQPPCLVRLLELANPITLFAVYMKADTHNVSNVASAPSFQRAKSAPCRGTDFKSTFPRQIQQLCLDRFLSSGMGPVSSLGTVCFDSLSRNNEKADRSDDLRIFWFDEEFGAEDMDEGVHPEFCDLFFFDP